MDEQDKIYRVVTENLPRKTSLYPRLIRLLSHRNQYSLPKERTFIDTQVCIHFSETAPLFEVRIGDRKYAAECPRVYIKRAGETHRITCADDNVQYSFDMIYDAKTNIEKLIPDDLVLFPLELTPRIHALVGNARELLPHIEEDGVCDRVDELCFSILHEILLANRVIAPKTDLHEKQIRRAVSWLHIHMLSPIDWRELAGRFGFSERSFNRYWKTYMKESPHQYLISLRMKEAKCLLMETRLSVGEIAGKVGYASLESFGFAFRKRFGISPHAFRRRHR
ncbi:MAG: helix-turn-helix transcriptional regulator [Lentisphaerae bacterium]|nr:helix-turn-helix transcriptional regulator [Lentisphaerota bacterium]